MAYYICCELWLYPKYLIHMLGFICCMVFKCGSTLGDGMNYILWVLICSNGGQGGELNVYGKSWVSSLGLGLARWLGSFATLLREFCLWSALWHGALEVGSFGRYSFQSNLSVLKCFSVSCL